VRAKNGGSADPGAARTTDHVWRPRQGEDAEDEGPRNQSGPVRALELREQIPDVIRDRLIGDVKSLSGFVRRLSFRQLLDDLTLAIGQVEARTAAWSAEMRQAV
jgi:hypothetical protein